MQPEIRVALAGVGGYGTTHVRSLLDGGGVPGARLVAGVDPHPPAPVAEELRAAGIPIYRELSELFSAGPAVDLVIIAAPIHLHAPLSCLALEHGANVLCEKPLAGSLADALRIIRTADATGRFAAIAYQWSYSRPIQTLKADILAGAFGPMRRMRTICVWPRTRWYYQRSPWAGRLVLEDGAAVLDSPVNNATAHYLHNMLYLAGPTREQSALPRQITAELYRANPIESYDTAALRAVLPDGAEILFYTTHAAQPLSGPVFDLEFERATVHYHAQEDPVIRARLSDGTSRVYGDPNAAPQPMLHQVVAAIAAGAPLACDARAALPHTLCVTTLMESARITPLAAAQLRIDPRPNDDTLTWMPGLSEALWAAYTAWRLPAERGETSWAVAGRVVNVAAMTS